MLQVNSASVCVPVQHPAWCAFAENSHSACSAAYTVEGKVRPHIVFGRVANHGHLIRGQAPSLADVQDCSRVGLVGQEGPVEGRPEGRHLQLCMEELHAVPGVAGDQAPACGSISKRTGRPPSHAGQASAAHVASSCIWFTRKRAHYLHGVSGLRRQPHLGMPALSRRPQSSSRPGMNCSLPRACVRE